MILLPNKSLAFGQLWKEWGVLNCAFLGFSA